MTLTPYENKYHHNVVDCPFCKYVAYVRPVTKVSPDALRDLKRHITNAAKNEAFAHNLALTAGEPTSGTPHLNYYKEHTKEKPVVKSKVMRQYDDDLTV